MQIKNKIFLIIICFLCWSVVDSNLRADEFNISALEITIDKENNIVEGTGSVEVTDKQVRIIKADSVTYEKKKNSY